MIAATVGALLLSSMAFPYSGQCSYVQEQAMVDGAIQLKTVMNCPESAPTGAQPIVNPPRDSDWDASCVRTAISVDLDPASFCDLPPNGAPPTVTPGLVQRAFERIPLPAAALVIQPPNGRTLVNFKTNFYTEQGEFSRTVTLLGRQVELRIWPAGFTWRFGDGATQASTSPGAAYPHLEITHEYARKGQVSPSVDVTYAAQFRVGGGPWRDVAGTVTIPGAAQQLRVVEARPVLVGG